MHIAHGQPERLSLTLHIKPISFLLGLCKLMASIRVIIMSTVSG